MARVAAKSQFGALLRALRLRQSLTLKQVAAASRELSVETAGHISNPYLSQLERGRVVAVSLPKLITLATLYGLDVRELIEKAPQSRREKLAREIADWRGSGRRIPDPVEHYVPSDERKSSESRLDALLSPLARAVSIPLQWELAARAGARHFVLHAAALPYLETAGRDAIRVFWSTRLGYARVGLLAGPNAAHAFWTDAVEQFQSWLIYETHRAEAVFALVSSWSINFETHLTACHFNRSEHEQAYAFDEVPLSLVRGIRCHSLARLLAASAPRALRAVPPPPPVIGGVRQYLRALIDPELPRSESLKTPSIGSVIGMVTALARAMPGLATAPADAREIEAVVSFLRRSGLSADA